MLYAEVISMNIAEFIRGNKDLKDLPFLVVFRTIFVLREMGMLKDEEEKDV
jgi:hypothetical protein